MQLTPKAKTSRNETLVFLLVSYLVNLLNPLYYLKSSFKLFELVFLEIIKFTPRQNL